MNGEHDHIALCKQLIEEKFRFEKNGGDLLRQRDLEYLAAKIEEVSGTRLSLSTLKRLWKKDYDQTPHPSTLDALVSLLGYKDWQDFKQKHAISREPQSATKKQGRVLKKWMALPLAAAAVVLFWLITSSSRESDPVRPLIKGPVLFTGNKTVSQGVPNTVIFNYDVGNIEADSFFFQQSWNDREKVKLDPNGKVYSAIYYYPGFHKAKLIANDSIVKRFRVHITTDGWMPMAAYARTDQKPIYLNKKNFVSGGAFHVDRGDLTASNVSVDQDFVVSYFNVREFNDTHSDNFTLDARVRSDSSNTAACPGFEVVVMCEVHVFFVGMMGKGCESDNGIKMGEVIHFGERNDLSAFGRDIQQWQDLRIQVVDKKATISLDQKEVYQITFKQDFGKVVGLAFHFAGTGAVDHVRLKNGAGVVVLEDDFKQ